MAKNVDKSKFTPEIMEKLYNKALNEFNHTPTYLNYVTLTYRCDNFIEVGIVKNQIETKYHIFTKTEGVWESYWEFIYNKYISNKEIELEEKYYNLLTYLNYNISEDYEQELDDRILSQLDNFMRDKKKIPFKFVKVRQHLNWLKYLSKKFEYNKSTRTLTNKRTNTPVHEELYMVENDIPNLNSYIKPLKKEITGRENLFKF